MIFDAVHNRLFFQTINIHANKILRGKRNKSKNFGVKWNRNEKDKIALLFFMSLQIFKCSRTELNSTRIYDVCIIQAMSSSYFVTLRFSSSPFCYMIYKRIDAIQLLHNLCVSRMHLLHSHTSFHGWHNYINKTNFLPRPKL